MSDYERGYLDAVKEIARRLDAKPYAVLAGPHEYTWNARTFDLLADEVRKLKPKERAEG